MEEQDVRFIEQLGERYSKKGWKSEFAQEKPFFDEIVPTLRGKLPESGFTLEEPRGIGSTAVVLLVHHTDLDQKRALKLPRPRLARLKYLLPVVRDERERLASISHQNVIRIYGSGELKFQVSKEEFVFPYFIMEYLDPVGDFDQVILENRRSLTAAKLIAYFRDALTGIAVLHREDIVHCDIKPGNLLIAPGKQALVTDLGYAKYIFRGVDERKTEVRFTPKYAHPGLLLAEYLVEASDPDANVSKIPRKLLKRSFDLFAFGRTMQDVLHRLREHERNDPPREDGNSSVFTPYQWNYLSIISKRLLDGVVRDRLGEELLSDLIPGFGDREMQDLRYSSADQALEDFEKLLQLYDLEGKVPELNPHLSVYIQVPHCRVPMTERVRAVVDHPAFARLAQVSQLGFVSNLYPGATHSRLEHVYGTFAHCCEYIRALWYDEGNCVFQAVMSKGDIEAGLLAALLHDIAQYPMAHDLTEIFDEFDHEDYTERILHRPFPGQEESIADVVEAEWNIAIDEVLRILALDEQPTIKQRILHSVISGPIDCDKLDYVRRDSTHLGVNFGSAVDHHRLLRHLTVANDSSEARVKGVFIKVLDYAEIGVRWKALVVANSLLQARMDLFTQVYWHHTTRTMKAMLAQAVRKMFSRLDPGEKERFRSEFYIRVFDPHFYLRVGRAPSFSDTKENVSEDPCDDFSSTLGSNEDAGWPTCSHLTPSDDALLAFLLEFADTNEGRLLNALRARRLYKRVFVLSGRGADQQDDKEQQRHKEIYKKFQGYRSDQDTVKIEQLRLKWQNGLIGKICERLKQPSVATSGVDLSKMRQKLALIEPLILVDIPVKTTPPGVIPSKVLRFLTEDSVGVHNQRQSPIPKFDTSKLHAEDETFDTRVGKIRVLAHPDYTDLFVQTLEREDYFSVLTV